MAKYIKEHTLVRFNSLLNNTAEIRKYNDCISFNIGFPSTYYLWVINGSEIVFFKRPRIIVANPAVEKVVIDFPNHKVAKIIATRCIDRKMLNKIFNRHTKSIIL